MTDSSPGVSFATSSDTEAIRALFFRSFGEAMSEALWHWKYGNGRGLALIRRGSDGNLTAHYGAIRRPVCFRGHDAVAIQIGDVMVPPEARGALSRNGPFFQVASTMLDTQIGYGKPHLLGFGFPNTRAMRLGEKLGLYAEVDHIVEARWTPAACLPWRWNIKMLNLDVLENAIALDRLWLRMRDFLPTHTVPIRNSAWWQHRYLQHPERRYQLYWIMDAIFRRPTAAFVLRAAPSGREHEMPWELMDWVGHPGHVDRVISAARTVVAKAGGGALLAWCSSAVAQRMNPSEGEFTPLDVKIPTSVRQPGPALDAIRGNWWLTGGDTDFR